MLMPNDQTNIDSSLSSRRAWIEIQWARITIRGIIVALLAEGVD